MLNNKIDGNLTRKVTYITIIMGIYTSYRTLLVGPMTVPVVGRS